jgi:hypothetical protein
MTPSYRRPTFRDGSKLPVGTGRSLPSGRGREDAAMGLAETARRLRARGDAINGAVWFSAEETGYPGIDLPGAAASMAARAACLGPVAPEVAAALFAPIHPANELASLRAAWRITTPSEILDARERAVIAWMERALGGVPDGLESLLAELEGALDTAPTEAHPVFAALRTLPRPSHPLARLQRCGEMIRERRGDSHRNAWSAAGLSSVELCVLSDAWRGSAMSGPMGWPEADRDAALESLQARGWLDADGTITDEGRAARDAIEAATDLGDEGLIDALGDRADAVIDALSPLARQIVAAGADTAVLRRRNT